MIRTYRHFISAALLCVITAGCTSLPQRPTPAAAAGLCPPPAWQGVLMADLTQPATARTYLLPDGVTTCTVDLVSP